MAHYDDALAEYARAQMLDPHNVAAVNGRAEVFKAMGRYDEALVEYERAQALDPRNAYAVTGRAEALKAIGRYEEALEEYDKARANNSYDRVAGTGRACVLATLGRFDDALQTLSDRQPRDLHDWIDLHVRAMILLRLGRTAEAKGILTVGTSDSNPFLDTRDYFRTAFALVTLREGRLDEATEVLEQISNPACQNVANVLRFDSYGRLGAAKRALAEEADRALEGQKHPTVIELRTEFRRRYLRSEPPAFSDEVVFQKEIELALAA